jgi:hypothetical protein
MRFLNYQLYRRGKVGFFNNLMSLELAVGLSILSNRRLLLNYPEFPVFNSDKQRTLFDLVELFHPHQTGDFSELKGALLPDLHVSQIAASDLATHDGAAVLATRNDSTLGYYSYVLPFDERIVYACNHLIAVKEEYRRTAVSIVNRLQRRHGKFASVHVRRSDFGRHYKRSETVTGEEILRTIRCHVPADCFLVIHSDERDRDYFSPILEAYPEHCLIDDALFREFYPKTLDAAEIGVVSALIASQSDIFLGTMFSTFTGYIQRRRLLNGKKGGFLYLYNQCPGGLAFEDGRIPESGTSGPTWERIAMSDELRSICFWWREWPESVYPQERAG